MMQVENHDSHADLMEQEEVQQVSCVIGFIRLAINDGQFVFWI
jgi:hypothetical protein